MNISILVCCSCYYSRKTVKDIASGDHCVSYFIFTTMCTVIPIYTFNYPLVYHTVQQLFTLCTKKKRIILLLTFKSLQLPSFPARYKLYSKRYFIIFTNTKGLQLFPESSFVWYHLWNNVANLLYTSNNAILYIVRILVCFFSLCFLFLLLRSEICRINRNKLLLAVFAIS